MIGRAGRPQFDTSGVAVIMTSTDSVSKYKNLDVCPPLESSLHHTLAEKINIEVALGNIATRGDATKWLNGSFLSKRFHHNPTIYQQDDMFQDLGEKTLEALLSQQIDELTGSGVLSQDASGNLSASELGQIMYKQNMKLSTVKLFNEMKNESSMRDILMIISSSTELATPVKRAEKKILNALHKQCKFQITKTPKSKSLKLVQEPWMKCFVLIQAGLSRFPLDDRDLIKDSRSILSDGTR